MINLKKTAAVLAVLTLLGGCSRAKTEISATPLTQPLASPVSTETPVSASQAESEKRHNYAQWRQPKKVGAFVLADVESNKT